MVMCIWSQSYQTHLCMRAWHLSVTRRFILEAWQATPSRRPKSLRWIWIRVLLQENWTSIWIELNYSRRKSFSDQKCHDNSLAAADQRVWTQIASMSTARYRHTCSTVKRESGAGKLHSWFLHFKSANIIHLRHFPYFLLFSNSALSFLGKLRFLEYFPIIENVMFEHFRRWNCCCGREESKVSWDFQPCCRACRELAGWWVTPDERKHGPTTLMGKTLSVSGTDFPVSTSEHSQTIFGDSFIIAGGREYTNDIRHKTVYRWWHN